MEGCSNKKWEDLNLTKHEVKTIGEALQKEEFRNLLLEYVKEINDPENRKQYENEITQLENERGVEIKFVHPSSGYVIKTSVDGVSKAFINICSSTNVGKPFTKPDINGGRKGLQCSIPYCLAPPREDFDKKKNTCTVFDVIFHPDTLHMTKTEDSFAKLVNDTALGAVEENFHVSLDKINLKFPKLQYKGTKHATVIRKKIENFQCTEVFDIPNYPYPPLQEENKQVINHFKSSNQNEGLHMQSDDSKYAMPKYTIKYRNNIDMQDYTNDSMTKMTITVPNELVIVIDLPLLKRASNASVDVSEKLLTLLSENPAKYKLKLKLPYVVDSSKGSAKFDINKKTLIITLPVIRQKKNSNLDAGREDSGVECDNYRRNSSISSDDEGEVDSFLTKTIPHPENIPFEKEIEICGFDANPFLEPNLHYLFPNFICQYLEDNLIFTLQVPNVIPESVKHVLKDTFRAHISFESVGAGYFPNNYAICILLPRNVVEHDPIKIEVGDYNVIVSFKLNNNVCYRDCYVGLDQNSLQKIELPARVSLYCENLDKELKLEEKCTVNGINKNGSEKDCNSNHSKSGERDKDELVASMNTTGHESDKFSPAQLLSWQSDETQDPSKENNTQNDEDTDEWKYMEGKYISESASSFDESTSSPRHQPIKTRTMSESHQESFMRKSRGILKIGRSLSESSVDDYASRLPEKLEKTKKTVRFSETISKQTFRMNSSIIGQRKKNQRKMRNKKRAQERRLSESGNDSEGESDTPFIRGNNFNEKKEIDVGLWFQEPDSSSCDASDVSGISESDDGQKEDLKNPMPCSSKKNHKRRGKKSARKNAATAKLQFIDN